MTTRLLHASFARILALTAGFATAAGISQAAPAPNKAAASQPAASIRQWHGSWGGGSGFQAYVIHDSRSWGSLWERVRRSPPCRLDPAASMAVFIAIGERPTGGYRADVVSAAVEHGHLVVRYREIKPSPETYVIEAITYPWTVALLPRSKLPVVFRLVGSSG